MVEGENVRSCGHPIMYFYPSSVYDMANEMLLYCKCICYFATFYLKLIASAYN